MILSIVVILVVALVAYIHYVQGLLSGIISAVMAVVAAMMAISYAEPLSDMMNGGKYADASFGICLIGIFVIVYLIGRVVFDSLVPGNVRLPHIADGVGGAICGLVAGIFATGIVMIAFQSMPFGPSIGGYARYEVKDQRQVRVVLADNPNRQYDRVAYDELVNNDLQAGQQGLILPVDDIVLGMAKRLSNGGALAGQRPLESVHPDLLQEFFGQRIGIEVAAKHTAFTKGSPAAEVKFITLMGTLPKQAAESTLIREGPAKGEKLAASPGKRLVAVTVTVKPDAAEADKIIRISTGNVRIVTKTVEGGWKNNFPLGTVQPVGGVWHAWINKPDDFLFLDKGGAHFLFELDESVFVTAPDAKPAAPAAAGAKPAGPDAFQLEEGTFLEVKRLARVPLHTIRGRVGNPPEGAQFYPMRKKELLKETPAVTAAGGGQATPPNPPPGNPPTPPAGAPGVPTEENGWKTSTLQDPTLAAADNKIPFPFGVGPAESDADVAFAGYDGHLTGKKFDTLNTDVASPESTPEALAKNPPTIQELFVPPGQRMVQVKFRNAGTTPWAWRNHIQRFNVYADGTKTIYGPFGAYGLLKGGGDGPDRLFFVYKAQSALTRFPEPPGKLDEVTLIYLIPDGQKATEVRYESRPSGLPLEK